MTACFIKKDAALLAIAIIPVTDKTLSLYVQDAWMRAWFTTSQFQAKPGQVCLLPKANTGELLQVFVGVADKSKSLWSLAGLPALLPEGHYQLLNQDDLLDEKLAATGFGLGCYQFDRYKKKTRSKACLAVNPEWLPALEEQCMTIGWVRDLINTPAEDMGPDTLAEEAMMLATDFNASCQMIVGEQLLAKNYPAVYAVGRAAERAPRLIDLCFGNPQHPKVTLIGKGVCFDSGGLDIKGSDGMLIMKKDMGGAAHVLGLARLIMLQKLPIQLRVLIPAVENAISGNAYRPGDVLHTRKGLTVEVTNTDAEGRLVLADALAEACQDKPELIIDFATLTGAARIALGTELPALFCNRAALALEVMAISEAICDPLWPMPLFAGYKDMLESPIADLVNSTKSSYAGAITAGLFLQEFVEPGIDWMHIDVMAWNIKSKPGRPEGGEAMGLRAIFAYLVKRYAA